MRPGISFLLSAVIFLMTAVHVFCQETKSPEEESPAADSVSNHSLYISGGYGNDLVYFGSTISEAAPYYYSSLIYGFGSEWYASFSAFHLANDKPFIRILNETITYSHVINTWFDYSLSLSGFQSLNNNNDSTEMKLWYGDITLGLDWRIIYTRLSVGALASDGMNLYTQITNSRYFETTSFTKKKLYFAFDPYINTILGTYKKGDAGTQSAILPPQASAAAKKTDTSQEENRFGLVEIDFGLPVSLNSDRYTLEAEPGYIFPFNTDPNMPVTKGFTFSLSLYVKLF